MINFNNLIPKYEDVLLFEKEISQVILSGQFLMGQKTEIFERNFSNYLGGSYVVSCANGTDALYLALASLDLDQGTEIVMTANCGMYAASAAIRLGLVPLFVDINFETGQIDINQLQECLTSQTKAVAITHLYGIANNMTMIKKICSDKNIYLIEDVAQATGGEFKGQKLGTFGDVSTFSFYPTKNLGSLGDAGAVVTNNSELNKKLQKLKQYGWGDRYNSELSGGINSRMDEIQAAIVSKKLEFLDKLNAERYRIFDRYVNSITTKSINFVGAGMRPRENVAHLAVLISEKRDELQNYFNSAGIQTLIHYPIPDHMQQSLIGKFKIFDTLRQTEKFSNQVLSIPCNPSLTEKEIVHVCTVLGKITDDI